MTSQPSPRTPLQLPSLWWQWSVPVLCLLAAVIIWTLDLNQSLFLWFNHLGLGNSLNHASLNNNTHEIHDRFWASTTLFGDTLAAFSLLALFLRKRPDIVWLLFISALFTTLWVHGLKYAVDTQRPLLILGADNMHVIGKSLNHFSFPSGHTATAFTLAAVICLRGVHPALAITALLLATLVGVSRAVVGAHWPTDILAGAFGGWLSVLIGLRLYARWPVPKQPVVQIVLTLILAACALSLLLVHESGYPLAKPFQTTMASISLTYIVWIGWQAVRQTLRERRAP
jgi:membrane-associated phospholipid phosphatase